MEIKQLEYFRAIVDEGNVSAAARALHMTQPPLSYQMKMLEEELQVQLFIRGTKRITLTETGKALYDRTAITLAKHGLGVAILPSSMRELNPCLYAYFIKDTE